MGRRPGGGVREEFSFSDFDLLKVLGNASGGFKTGSNIGMDTTNAGGALTYNGVIADPNANVLGFAKLGTGTLILTGANTYTGTTTVAGGTLQVGDGAAPAGAIGSGGVTVNTGGNLAFARPDAVSFGGIIAGTGDVTKSAAGTLTLSAANTHSGATTVNAGILKLTNSLALQNSTVSSINDGIVFDQSVATKAFTFGALSGSGNMALANNATTAITLTVGGNNTSTTYSGVLSGAGALTKVGAGTLIMAGTNTYTGVTAINGGVLSVSTLANGSANSSIGASSPAAGNLSFGGGTLSYTGGSVSTDRAFTLTANSGIEVTNAATTLTMANDVTAQGASKILTKSGDGILVLGGSADNSSLFLSVTGGEVDLAKSVDTVRAVAGISSVSAGARVKLTGTGTDQIYDGSTAANMGVNGLAGTLDLSGHSETTSNFNGTSTGLLTSSAAGNVTWTVGGTNATSAFAGTIENGSGTMALTKIGSGTQTLTGMNTYTGVTTITAGVLTTDKFAAAGAASGIGAATGDATNLVFGAASATLRYTGSDDASLARGFTLSSGAGGGGTLESSGTGTLAVGNSSVIAYGAADETRTFTLSGTNTGANTFGKVLTNNGTGATSFTKSGAGQWTMTGMNSYTGVTTISGGILSIDTLAAGGVASNIGAASNDAANLVINGATLRYTGGAVSTDRLFTLGTGGATLDASGTGAFSWTNPGSIILPGNGARTLTLTGSNSDSNVLAASIGNNANGATSINKTGAGTWVLAGANTFSGGVSVVAGNLDLRNNSSQTVAGVVSGLGTLIKSGTGRLTLSNPGNTLSGLLNANGGEVYVTGRLNSSGLWVNVNNGGTLLLDGAAGGSTGLVDGIVFVNDHGVLYGGGDGTTSGKAATLVINGGEVRPGLGLGTLSAGSLDMNGGTFRFDLDGSATTIGGGVNDLVAVSGPLTFLGGTILPSFVSAPVSGNVYTLFTSDTLSNLPTIDPAATTNTRLSYALGTTGNNVELTVTGSTKSLTWTGAANKVWNVNTTANWVASATEKFFQADSVTFDGAAAGTITLAGSLMPAAITVNSAADYTFTGTGSIDAGHLTKAGTGMLKVLNTNTLPGGATISGGVLSFANGALGSTGPITMDGGTLQWNGTNTQDVSASLRMVDARTATFDINGNDVTLGSGFGNSSTGALTKIGAGTLTLAGTNTYTGATTVSTGTLSIA